MDTVDNFPVNNRETFHQLMQQIASSTSNTLSTDLLSFVFSEEHYWIQNAIPLFFLELFPYTYEGEIPPPLPPQ